MIKIADASIYFENGTIIKKEFISDNLEVGIEELLSATEIIKNMMISKKGGCLRIGSLHINMSSVIAVDIIPVEELMEEEEKENEKNTNTI